MEYKESLWTGFRLVDNEVFWKQAKSTITIGFTSEKVEINNCSISKMLPKPNLSMCIELREKDNSYLFETIDDSQNGTKSNIILKVEGNDTLATSLLFENIYITGYNQKLGLINLIVGGIEYETTPEDAIIPCNERKNPFLKRFRKILED